VLGALAKRTEFLTVLGNREFRIYSIGLVASVLGPAGAGAEPPKLPISEEALDAADSTRRGMRS
jgi:hypothetical protein